MQGKIALLVITVCLLFSLLTVGAYVTVANFGGACGVNTPEDWPLCNGQLLPPPDMASIIEYMHRILASLSGLFLILSAAVFWRSRDSQKSTKRLLLLALISIIAEIIVGGVVVNTGLSYFVVTIHQAIALLVFGLTVGATTTAFRPALGAQKD